jgi:hypothetical protein
MPYQELTAGEVAAAEPVSSELTTKIRDNFIDHESRLQVVEAANSVFPPIIFRVNGPYGLYGALDGILKTTTNFSFTITGVRILVDQAGTAGTVEVDIKRKRGGGAYETIFSTRPSVGFAAGDDALSSNAILDGSKTDIEAADILRLDQTSVQTGGIGYLVRIDYNRG